jgi:hypothetical protein
MQKNPLLRVKEYLDLLEEEYTLSNELAKRYTVKLIKGVFLQVPVEYFAEKQEFFANRTMAKYKLVQILHQFDLTEEVTKKIVEHIIMEIL